MLDVSAGAAGSDGALSHVSPEAHAAVSAIRAHATRCDRCQAVLAALGALDTPSGAVDPPSPTLDTPRATLDTTRRPADRSADTPTSLPGNTRLGRFVVDRVLGRGGMGVVYAAHDPELERPVAIKRLLAPATGDADAADRSRRLLREARAMAKVSHPNVVAIYDVVADDGGIHIAMELVADGTLVDWLAREARPWRAIVQVFVAIGEGLEAAHAAGLVHRDLKPANVLVTRSGQAKISDFGLVEGIDDPAALADVDTDDAATLVFTRTLTTRAGVVVGTPAYMAPEQLRGERATRASDQFAFGLCLYEALTGRRAFAAPSLAELRQAVLVGRRTPLAPPRDASTPPELFAVVDRCLALDPTARYASVGEVVLLLRAVLDGTSASSARSSGAESASGATALANPTANAPAIAEAVADERRPRRFGAIAVALAVGVVLAAGAFGVARWSSREASRVAAPIAAPIAAGTSPAPSASPAHLASRSGAPSPSASTGAEGQGPASQVATAPSAPPATATAPGSASSATAAPTHTVAPRSSSRRPVDARPPVSAPSSARDLLRPRL